jgi:predicted outer membrane protein
MAATRALLAVLVLSIAPACDDDDDRFVGNPAQPTLDEGFARGTLIADDAASELSGEDTLIVIGKTATILATLNDAEIAQADFAVQVVARNDVFDFGNRMIVDHADANTALDEVVRLYGAAFLPSTTADNLAGEANAGLADLRATPPSDIDFRYIELQVINHAEAQVLLDELALQVGPGAMGDYIANTRAMIDAHLSDATDLYNSFFL